MDGLQALSGEDAIFRAMTSLKALGPKVTAADFSDLLTCGNIIRGSDKAGLDAAGITLHGRNDCVFIIAKDHVKLRNMVIHNSGTRNVYIFMNHTAVTECNITLRVQGSDCNALFPDLSVPAINLPMIYMRSDKQTFFWGLGATSVMSRVEMEGAGRTIAVGDDCMFSSGVWIRNHDMHVIFDTQTGLPVNADAVDMVFEEHVWVGFDAFVLSAPRLGYGSIIGARSLVKQRVPALCLAAGSPAKIVKENVSWSRSASAIPEATRERLDRLALTGAAH